MYEFSGAEAEGLPTSSSPAREILNKQQLQIGGGEEYELSFIRFELFS